MVIEPVRRRETGREGGRERKGQGGAGEGWSVQEWVLEACWKYGSALGYFCVVLKTQQTILN